MSVPDTVVVRGRGVDVVTAGAQGPQGVPGEALEAVGACVTGYVDVGALSVQLSSVSVPLTQGVQVTAAGGNYLTVYGGMDAAVSPGTAALTSGVPLDAGDAVVFPSDDLNKVWVVTTATTTPAQRVYFLGV